MLRPPHSGRGLGHRLARRVHDGLHPVPGRSEPRDAAGHLRVPEHGHGTHRDGGLERLGVRRRQRACRVRTNGAAYPARQVAPGGSRRRLPPALHAHRGQHYPQSRCSPADVRPRCRRLRGTRWPEGVGRSRGVGRWPRRSGRPAAKLPRSSRAGGRDHGLGGGERNPGGRRGEPHLACAPQAAGRMGYERCRHRLWRRSAARHPDGLGRAVVRLHLHPGAPCAATSGAAGRAHVGSPRQARLHPDPAGPGTAHPPRQGEVEHLHQPRSVDDRGDHIHGADGCRRSRAHGVEVSCPDPPTRRRAHCHSRSPRTLRRSLFPRAGD